MTCPTKWHIHSPDLKEREHDYDAFFSVTNGETGAEMIVMITQRKGGPVSDLVGSLRATAQLLVKVANEDTLDTTKFN